MIELDVTKHFKDRCKSRLGISKKDALAYFSKAFKYGLRKKDFRQNRMFYIYLEHIIDEGEDIDCIVYCHYIIIMRCKSDDTYLAITILNIPGRYIRLVDNIAERKYKKKNAKRKRNQTKRYVKGKQS